MTFIVSKKGISKSRIVRTNKAVNGSNSRTKTRIVGVNLLPFIQILLVFGNGQGFSPGDKSLNIAVVVDAPWTELEDFSEVLSSLEEKKAIEINKYNLQVESDWQVRLATCFGF